MHEFSTFDLIVRVPAKKMNDDEHAYAYSNRVDVLRFDSQYIHFCYGGRLTMRNLPADCFYCIWSFLTIDELKSIRLRVPSLSSNIAAFFHNVKGQLLAKQWITTWLRSWDLYTILVPITVVTVDDNVNDFQGLKMTIQKASAPDITCLSFRNWRDWHQFSGDYPRMIHPDVFHVGVGKPRKPVITEYIIGEQFDCPDVKAVWYIVTIVDQTATTVTIRFEGWSSRWDQVVPKGKNNLCPLHSITTPWRHSIRVHDTLEYFENDKWFPVTVSRISRDTIFFYFAVDRHREGAVHRLSSRLCPWGVHSGPLAYHKKFSSFNHHLKCPYFFEMRRVDRSSNDWLVTM